MRPRAPRRGAAACGAAALLAAAAAGPGPAAAAADDGWRLRLQSQQHSDATALGLGRDPKAEDLAPRRGRNLAYIDDEARLERGQGAWSWGLLARSRATLVASADTLALYRQVDGGLPIDADRHWDVETRFRGFSGGGAVLGHRQGAAAGWSARWELQALVLRRWRERHIHGSAGASLASGEYRFALNSTQRDDGLRLPFQGGFPSHGLALLGAGAVAWQGPRWRFEAAVRDAGWQHWRALPRQDAVLDSRTSAVDAEGFLIYRPLVQGQNSQRSATRSAPVWGRLVARWHADPRAGLDAEAGADLLPGFGLLPWVGLAAPVGASALALQWRTHERRLTLRWDWQDLSLTAGADRLDGGRRSRELGLSWRLPI